MIAGVLCPFVGEPTQRLAHLRRELGDHLVGGAREEADEFADHPAAGLLVDLVDTGSGTLLNVTQQPRFAQPYVPPEAAIRGGCAQTPQLQVCVAVRSGDSCGLHTDATLTSWGDNVLGRTDAPTGTFTNVTAGAIHPKTRRPVYSPRNRLSLRSPSLWQTAENVGCRAGAKAIPLVTVISPRDNEGALSLFT